MGCAPWKQRGTVLPFLCWRLTHFQVELLPLREKSICNSSGSRGRTPHLFLLQSSGGIADLSIPVLGKQP